jgi:hypothetical protein
LNKGRQTCRGLEGRYMAHRIGIDQKTSKSEFRITAFEVVFFARVELNSQELFLVCRVTSPGKHSPS